MEFVQEHQKDDQYSYSDNREEEAHDDQHQDQEDEEDQDEVRNISTHTPLPLSFSASSSRYTSTNTNTNTNNNNNNSLQFMDYLSLKSGTSTSHSEEGIIICDDNNNNNNNNRGGVWLCGGGGGGGGGGEREHMFDKVVTPSDVGKLNRLVIPKQHAEKYFPLDSAANEKGLLLNFEDRNGKSWRFRYSYWNSSQSYVMTKGWSRFVKEKKLDAGDIVSFERGVGDSGKGRLYIDWRRRPHQHYQHHHALPNHNSLFPIDHHHQLQQYPSPYPQSSVRWGGGGGSGGSGGGLPYSLPMPPRQQQHENFQYNYDIQYPYLHHQCHHHHPLPPPHHQQHQISGIHDHYSMNYQVKISGNVVSPTTLESIPTGEAAAAMVGRIHHHGKSTTPPVAPSKRLRLFGVNMEYCPKEDQESADHVTMASLLSTTTTPPHHDHHQHHLIPSSSVPYHHQVRLPSNPSPLPITNINTAEVSRKGKSASLSFDLDP